MDGPREYHPKWSKSERERQILSDKISLIHRIYKLIQMNLYTKQKQTHRHGKQTGYQRGKGGGRDKFRSMRVTDTNYNM